MLTDAGPLAALIDRRDQYHQAAQRAFTRLGQEPLLTPCPCLTEAMHLLGRQGSYDYQRKLLDLVGEEALIVHHLTGQQEARASELMEQYRDRPMDYADAALVAVAETQRLQRIFTFDSDFRFYRLSDNSTLEVIP